MKFNFLTLALAAVLGLALAGAPVTTQAQTPAPAASDKPAATDKPIPYKGTLTAVDATSITVKGAGDPMTMAITPATKILKDKKPAAITDFAVNDAVTGSYTKDATTGALTAHSLHKGMVSTKTKTTSTPAPTPEAQ